MKGQYLTIEYVLFFAIGIVMVLGVYLTFTGINADIRADSSMVQMQKTGELIRSSIVNVYETGKSTNSVINYKLSIPPRLSGHPYIIRYDVNKNLNVNSTENYIIGDVLTVYNININSPNTIYSTNGVLNIRYEVDWIWLS